MEYIALLTFRPTVTQAERDAALARRSAWSYPEGIKVLGEYWPLSSSVQVVSIFAADEFASVMELVFEWEDVFDIDVHPAISADEGLRVGADVFSRLPRMRQPEGAPAPTA